MAITIDPTAPQDAESPRQGASRIRNLTLELLSLLTQGGGSAVTFNAAPFVVDTSGNVSIPTTLVVPTPTLSTQAATKGYVDGNITVAPTINNTITAQTALAGTATTIGTITSTPPAAPISSQKYRAWVIANIYCQSHTVSTNSRGLITITDNFGLFPNTYAGNIIQSISTNNIETLQLNLISQNTQTPAQGAVTFTVNVSVQGGTANLDILANSVIFSGAKSYIFVSWIPCQS